MDPLIMIVFVLFAGLTLWVHGLVKKLDQRLRNLEKQHLALVAEMERRLYEDRRSRRLHGEQQYRIEMG